MERQPDLRRLAAAMDFLSWVGYEDARPPGLRHRAVRLLGEDAEGRPVELVRADDGWVLRRSDGSERRLDPAETGSLALSADFAFHSVEVVDDFPELLFRGAVEQAEESLLRHEKALRDADQVVPVEGESDEGAAIFGLVLAMGEFDRGIRASNATMVLTVAAAEAQANAWAQEVFGGWGKTAEGKDEDRLPLPRKLKALAAKQGKVLDLGRGPMQALDQLIEARDRIAHPNATVTVVPLGGQGSGETPVLKASIAARRACKVVREVLVLVANAIEVEPPRYLAYCPPGDAADAGIWRTANVMTGTREDPIFPKATKIAERRGRKRRPSEPSS